MRRMSLTCNKEKLMTIHIKPPTKTMSEGDLVIFANRERSFTGKVLNKHIEFDGCSNRRVIIEAVGSDDDKDIVAFAKRAYGYGDTADIGSWPCYRDGDYAAATRLVWAIYAKLGAKLTEKQSAELEKASKCYDAKKKAEEKIKKQKLARLPVSARNFILYLEKHKDAFGCQREHVVATVGAILNVDLAPFV
jgi:hypothetical protein